MNFENLILHITIPKGLKTMDGAVLGADLTFDVASSLSPFYASIDQVKSSVGWGIRTLSDLTIASQVYMTSKAADMMSNCNLTPNSPAYLKYINARNQWVMAKSGMNLILSLGNLLISGSHVLANFSVTQGKNTPIEGIAGKLSELGNLVKFYDPSLRSCGRIEPGGHARPIMAAKGVMDWTERTPGREWNPNSAGANTLTYDPGSANGGRGKPVSYYMNPIYSGSLASYRVGSFQAGMSLDCRNTCLGG